jgi:hypothetical protein
MTTTSLSQQTNTSDTNRTSQSLILQAKARDPDAWERMVKLYSPLVYLFWPSVSSGIGVRRLA